MGIVYYIMNQAHMIKGVKQIVKVFGKKAEFESRKPAQATRSLVELASENWRFQQALLRSMEYMDPMDAERLTNQFLWYQRKVVAVLEEAGLRAVDLTGQIYDVGMAVTPLNLDDFRETPGMKYRIAQTVEPIIMEKGSVRRPGTVMLSEELGGE